MNKIIFFLISAVYIIVHILVFFRSLIFPGMSYGMATLILASTISIYVGCLFKKGLL